MNQTYRMVVFLANLFCLGCADDLNPHLELIKATSGARSEGSVDKTANGTDIPTRSGAFSHEVLLDGSTVLTTVDASDYEAWQFLDLDTGESTENGWDLKMQRFFFLSNGGETGGDKVRITKLKDNTDFTSLTVPPETGWLMDQPDGTADEDDEPDNAFNNGANDWYEYEVSTHTLAPRDTVFAVESTEGRYFKLQILDYYDDAGSPAILSFRWAELGGASSLLQDETKKNEAALKEEAARLAQKEAELMQKELDLLKQEAALKMSNEEAVALAGDEPVPCLDTLVHLTVDATSYEQWHYFNLRRCESVVVDEPSASLDWDIALQRYHFKTNSGASGRGNGGALLSESPAIESGMTLPNSEWSIDELVDEESGLIANPRLEQWYEYNSTTHQLTPKDLVYWIQLASGSYGLLKVESYASGIVDLALGYVGDNSTTWQGAE